MNICFVVNNPDFLISHRLDICKEALKKGYNVHVISANKESIHRLKLLGFIVHFHDVGRGKMNPIYELFQIFKYVQLFQKIKPDIVHLITIKPYLYGGIAARLAKVPAVVSAVAGLGILFSSSSFKYSLLRTGLYPLFWLAFGHKNQSVIFQNKEDRDSLVNWGVVAGNKVKMIRGSGVNLDACPSIDEPNGVPIIAFAARLLKDKGVEVFVEASGILKQRNIVARFWLIGEPDTGNSNTVTQEQLKGWEKAGLVELFGYRKDIPNLFSKSNIVTLPSYYGEGLPKVLIEAAACGRVVVTTDHPGCRDAIEPDTSGVLVPVRNAEALADAIQNLIENPEKRKTMGQAGRELAECEFAIEKVVGAHLKIYQELLENIAG